MLLKKRWSLVSAGVIALVALNAGPALADTGSAADNSVVAVSTQQVESAAPSGADAAESVLGFVSIPSNYVYDPSRGSLHDYCTASPDGFQDADFRGPCARHDMCYEEPGQKKAQCDNALRSNIDSNCVYAYPSATGPCWAAAATYWAAVVGFGDDPATPNQAGVATDEQQDIAKFAHLN